VAKACGEDHEERENNEIEKNASHDVGGVPGGETGEFVGLGHGGKRPSHKVKGEFDDEGGYTRRRAEAGNTTDSLVSHRMLPFLR
jgi:hypothetical protein